MFILEPINLVRRGCNDGFGQVTNLCRWPGEQGRASKSTQRQQGKEAAQQREWLREHVLHLMLTALGDAGADTLQTRRLHRDVS